MNNQTKSGGSKGVVIAAIALGAMAVILLAVFFLNMAKSTEGEKSITVQVVHGDGSTRDFPVKTTEEYLGFALVSEGIVEDNQSAYGLYILTADGETVNEANQEWWKVSKDGEALSVGADSAPIADGDHFELVFTVGYDG